MAYEAVCNQCNARLPDGGNECSDCMVEGLKAEVERLREEREEARDLVRDLHQNEGRFAWDAPSWLGDE